MKIRDNCSEYLIKLSGKLKRSTLFFLLYIALAAMTLCMLIVVLNLSRELVTNARVESAENRLASVAQAVSDSERILSEVAAQVAYNTYVCDWVNSSHLRTDMISMRNTLLNHSSIVTTNPLIYSIDLYSANSNKVLSTNSGYYSVYSPGLSGALISEQFLQWSSKRRKGATLSFINSASPDKGYGTLIYMTYISNTGNQGVVAVTSDVAQILNASLPANMTLCLSDPLDGWTVGLGRGSSNASMDDLLTYLRENSSATAIGRETATMASGASCSVLTLGILDDNLLLRALIPDVTLEALFRDMLPFVIGICALTLVAMLFVSHAACSIVYHPIQRMIDSGAGATARYRGVNEEPLVRLSQIMDEYNRQKVELQRSLDINRRYIHDAQVKDIIFGTYQPQPDAPAPAILSADGLYVIAAATIRDDQLDAGLLRKCLDEISEALGATAHEQFLLTKRSALLLVSLPQELSIQEIAFQAENALRKNTESVLLGISDTSRDSGDIPALGEQAMTASQIAEHATGGVVTYAQVLRESDGSHQSMVIWDFLTLLRTRSWNEAGPELARMFERQRELPPDQRQSFFLNLVYNIMRERRNYVSEREEPAQVNPFEELLNLSGYDEQQAYIAKLCESLISMRDESTRKYKRTSVEIAVQYLRLNFDKSISLSLLAEELGISQSYLSELLKKELNMTYLNYVHKLRVERARELLEKTELNIQQVADAVGYDTAHSFIRNFKKLMDTTPASYRAMAQETAIPSVHVTDG